MSQSCVNSEPYVDNRIGLDIPREGIDELIYAIATSLPGDDERLLGWFLAMANNTHFWESMSEPLSQHIQQAFQSIWDLVGVLAERVQQWPPLPLSDTIPRPPPLSPNSSLSEQDKSNTKCEYILM
ncbi:unnamed protein product [Didymodactylos carnosus]|uniref:Uncharacterized protein n=1 Tax=Didymodactylos carnosus TaxID=1234261 RepID=A0A814AFY0_9BILA|nr:unnamed protein product [Didymodactylos carnosus]CAF3694466.1 unnamed protein product [Didymodactylos carnosus]